MAVSEQNQGVRTMRVEAKIRRAVSPDAEEVSRVILRALRETNARDYRQGARCKVDEELKSGGLLHRQFGGLFTLQDPIYVNRRSASHCALVNSVGDQASSLKKLPHIAAARQITRKCEVRDHFPGLKDQALAVSDHPLHARLYHRVKYALKIAERAHLETLGIDAELIPG